MYMYMQKKYENWSAVTKVIVIIKGVPLLYVWLTDSQCI